MGLAWFLCVGAAAWAADQTVVFTVVPDPNIAPTALSVEGDWLGKPFSVGLVEAPGTIGYRVLTGSYSGPPARMVPIRLVSGATADDRKVLAATTEVLDETDNALTWSFDGYQARRVAAALPMRQMERLESATLAAQFGLGGLVLWFGVWLVEGGQREGRGRRRGRG